MRDTLNINKKKREQKLTRYQKGEINTWIRRNKQIELQNTPKGQEKSQKIRNYMTTYVEELHKEEEHEYPSIFIVSSVGKQKVRKR